MRCVSCLLCLTIVKSISTTEPPNDKELVKSSSIVENANVKVSKAPSQSSSSDSWFGNLDTLLDKAWKTTDQTVIQMFQNAGQAQEVITTARNVGGIAGRVLGTLGRGSTISEQRDLIVSSLTEELVNLMNDAEYIDDIEFNNKYIFACATDGSIYGLKNMLMKNTNVIDQADGSVIMTILYTFTKLGVQFRKLLEHIPGIPTPPGTLVVEYEDNEMEIVLNIPEYHTLINHAIASDCITHVKDFKVVKLGAPIVNLIADSHLRRHIIQNRITAILTEQSAMVSTKIERKILTKVHERLSTSGSWVCEDKGLIDLIKSKGEADTTYSDVFHKYCGKENQHTPL